MKVLHSRIDPYKVLKSGRESFLMKVSSTSRLYDIAGKKILYRPEFSKVKPYQMGAISHVKSRGAKAEPFAQKRGDPVYIRDFQPDKIAYPKAWEIDISSAYWQTANIYGIIEKEIYEKYEGKKGGWKLARNMAIGTLNSTKHVYYCEPGGSDSYIEMLPAPAPKVYRKICGRVGDFLSELAGGLDIESIFFWVDQIYTTEKPDFERVKKLGDKWGYKLKFEPVKVSCYTKKFSVFSEITGKRVFYRKKRINGHIS